MRDWASRLQDAVAGFNESGVPVLYGSAPEDLRGPHGEIKNKDLFFDRQYEDSKEMQENSSQIKARGEKVTAEGAFRVYQHKERLGRRIFDPHWSRETHSAEEVNGAFVKDEHGDVHPTKEVLPVPTDSTVLPEAPHNLNAAARALLQRYADRAVVYLTAKPDHRDYSYNLHKDLSSNGYNIKDAVKEAGLSGKSVIASFVAAFPDKFRMVTSKTGGTSHVELKA